MVLPFNPLFAAKRRVGQAKFAPDLYGDPSEFTPPQDREQVGAEGDAVSFRFREPLFDQPPFAQLERSLHLTAEAGGSNWCFAVASEELPVEPCNTISCSQLIDSSDGQDFDGHRRFADTPPVAHVDGFQEIAGDAPAPVNLPLDQPLPGAHPAVSAPPHGPRHLFWRPPPSSRRKASRTCRRRLWLCRGGRSWRSLLRPFSTASRAACNAPRSRSASRRHGKARRPLQSPDTSMNLRSGLFGQNNNDAQTRICGL